MADIYESSIHLTSLDSAKCGYLNLSKYSKQAFDLEEFSLDAYQK